MSADDTFQDETNTVLEANKAKRRDREASEDRLIKAAIEIFAKYGYNGSTTKKIAQKAQVNESLIGRYFDGKEGLLLTIVERFVLEAKKEQLPYTPQDNLIEELKKYVDFKLGSVDKKQALGKIIIAQALTDDKFRKKSLEKVPIFCDEALLERLQLLQQKGQILKDLNVTQLTMAIENFLHGQFIFDLTLKEISKEKVLKNTHQYVEFLSSSTKIVPIEHIKNS